MERQAEMASSGGIPILNRPDFFDGQQLLAADLTEVQRYHRELRWLHNRSLHSWGIAFGLAVAGGRGDRTVSIAPGYALDCLGRDLILTDPPIMPVPAVAGGDDGSAATYYLTLSYAEDADLPAEDRAGACGTSGAVRRPERPIVRWQDPDATDPESRFRQGLDIVLGTISVRNCQLDAAVSDTARRNAIPARQPYIAAGQTPAGATDWRLWPDSETPLGLTTTVSTSSAGFRITPAYEAHVMGERIFALTVINGSAQAVVEGYQQIAEPTASSFELRVLLPDGVMASSGGSRLSLNPAEVLTDAFTGRLQVELDWHVVWMGIEG
jgi:hypothetical protein